MAGTMRRAAWSLIDAAFLSNPVRAEGPQPGEPKSPEPAAKLQSPQLPPDTPAKPDSTPPHHVVEERPGLTPAFEVRGRIEVDTVVAAQSMESIQTIGDLQNGYGFRRVRLGVQGTIGDAAHWVSEIEVAGAQVRLKDVFIGLTAFPWVRELRAGYFREPFSLEGATSSNFITFMERSPLNVLDPARNWGIAGYWWPESERVLFAIGVFRNGTTNGGQSLGDGDNWAVTSRLTGLPVYEPDDDAFRLVHIGGAVSLRRPLNGVVNFAPTPQDTLLTVEDSPSSPFLPPVMIPANSVQEYNLQAARVVGPFSAQAEWFGTAVQHTNAGVVFVHGFYIDASYFLTGEHRGYDRTRGAFDKVAVRRPLLRSRDCPSAGFGAVEVAARFTIFDLDSPNIPLAPDGSSSAAILYQLTLGVNWYL